MSNNGSAIVGENAAHVVGDFFENCACHLFYGERIGGTNGDYDVVIPGIGSMEVKSCNTDHPARLRVEQLLVYKDEQETNFLDPYRFYAIFRYRNRGRRIKDGKRVSLISRQHPDSANAFLASRTTLLWVLDLRVITAIHEAFGERQGSLPFEKKETPVVEINYDLIKRFGLQSRQQMFESLNLDPQQFVIVQHPIRTLFEGIWMQFEATFVLDRTIADQMLRRTLQPSLWSAAASQNGQMSLSHIAS